MEELRRKVARGVSVALYRQALAAADNVFFLNEADVKDFEGLDLLRPGQAILLGASVSTLITGPGKGQSPQHQHSS